MGLSVFKLNIILKKIDINNNPYKYIISIQ